ncbi:hypothetical protein BASA81_002503 [Batrachochytrium salamandrivorans]|nr:hypothetical protein BASA81_002503 [Batrachochytrium salamandrivorans]
MLLKVIQRSNAAFKAYPAESGACMLACEIGSIYSSYLVLHASGLTIPSSFAVGFALSRPLRRLRLPLDLAAAGLLKKAVPALGQLELSELFRGLGRTSTMVERANQSLGKSFPVWSTTMGKLGGMMDDYGASYFFASRWMGALSVLACTGAIEYGGVDVLDSVFDYLGVSKATGFGAGVLGPRRHHELDTISLCHGGNWGAIPGSETWRVRQARFPPASIKPWGGISTPPVAKRSIKFKK